MIFTYFNMFTIYVALTKGQRPSFKQFLKPSLSERFRCFLLGEKFTISNRFLDDCLKCLRLFRCFFEAGDKDIYTSIENAAIFQSKEIDLRYTTLSPSDVECISIFLAYSSHKEWKELNLTSCFIQDHGIQILHRGLISCDVTITRLGLSWNGFTNLSSSTIGDLTVNCKIKVLRINGNKSVCEDDSLFSILSDPSSMIEELYMASTNLSCSATVKLFTAVGKSKKLRILGFTNNDIKGEACDAIIVAMKKNTSLVELWMNATPTSGDQAQLIIQALQENNILQWLQLPYYNKGVRERISSSAAEVNQMRKSYDCQVKLEIRCGNYYVTD